MRSDNLFFFRDSRGLECDLLFETGGGLTALEIKAGATVASGAFASLDAVARAIPDIAVKAVVYGGTVRQSRSNAEVVPFDELSDALERLEVGRETAAFARPRRAASSRPSPIAAVRSGTSRLSTSVRMPRRPLALPRPSRTRSCRRRSQTWS